MIGEYYYWHILANKMGRTVQELQNSMTSSEFVNWMVFEEMQLDRPSPDHFYLSRIVMEIRSIFHKNPSSLKLEDFLLKFNRDPSDKKTSKEDAAAKLQKSKSVWSAMASKFGFKKKEVDPDTVPHIVDKP